MPLFTPAQMPRDRKPNVEGQGRKAQQRPAYRGLCTPPAHRAQAGYLNSPGAELLLSCSWPTAQCLPAAPPLHCRRPNHVGGRRQRLTGDRPGSESAHGADPGRVRRRASRSFILKAARFSWRTQHTAARVTAAHGIWRVCCEQRQSKALCLLVLPPSAVEFNA